VIDVPLIGIYRDQRDIDQFAPRVGGRKFYLFVTAD